MGDKIGDKPTQKEKEQKSNMKTTEELQTEFITYSTSAFMARTLTQSIVFLPLVHFLTANVIKTAI